MANQRFRVLAGYLAMGDTNVYRDSEVELDPNKEGTKILLEMGAIEKMSPSASMSAVPSIPKPKE